MALPAQLAGNTPEPAPVEFGSERGGFGMAGAAAPEGWQSPAAALPTELLEQIFEAMPAVGETVILLHPPLSSLGVSIGINRGCQ